MWQVEWDHAMKVIQLMSLQRPHRQHHLLLPGPPPGTAESMLAVVKPTPEGRRGPVRGRLLGVIQIIGLARGWRPQVGTCCKIRLALPRDSRGTLPLTVCTLQQRPYLTFHASHLLGWKSSCHV
jgi:hypothetical protein